MNQLPQLKRII